MGKTYKKTSKKNQRIIDIFKKKTHLKNKISPFLQKSRNTIFTIVIVNKTTNNILIILLMLIV